MLNESFLGSLKSHCRRCAIRALVVTASLVGPAVIPAIGQEKLDVIEVQPASRVPASPMLASTVRSSPEVLRHSVPTPTAERILSFTTPERRSAFRDSAHAEFLPAFEKQRTPFQSQVRLPIREFFGGRVELACVHSKSRHVSVHSAVPRSAQSYRLHSPYAASLAPRTRASLTLGLWFRM